MSENLIYMVAFGAWHRNVAEMSIKTLKTVYNDDIILITGKDCKGLSCLANHYIKKIDVPEDFTTKRKSLKKFKFTAFKHLPLKNYRKIAYFDCDILFANSVQHIFDTIHENNIACISEFGLTLFNTDTCKYAFRNQQEIDVSQRILACNSGFVGATSTNFIRFCKHWRRNMNEPNSMRDPSNPPFIFDQPAYNATLMQYRLKKSLPQPKLLPSHTYSFNGERMKSVIFSHFTNDKDHMVTCFHDIIKNKIQIKL